MKIYDIRISCDLQVCYLQGTKKKEVSDRVFIFPSTVSSWHIDTRQATTTKVLH